MLRCTAVARIAAGAAKPSTGDVPQLTRTYSQLSLAPLLARCIIRSPNRHSSFRAFATVVLKTEGTKTAVKTTKTRAKSKPAAKKAKTKAKPRLKAGTKKKAAPKKKKKKVVVKKAAPKKKKKKVVVKKAAPKRKVLTEKQKDLATKKKERDAIKTLRETALVEPKAKPDNAYTVFMSEAARNGTGTMTSRVKEAVASFKAISAAELEHYNHISNENKAENESAYKAWVNKHTPEQIRLANTARKSLQRKLGKTKTGRRRQGRGLSAIKDERQIKRPETAYLKFSVDRRGSGDFKNIAFSESAKLITQEWKDLSAGDKKKYTDLQAADTLRYTREFSSTYGHPPPLAKAPAASATV